MCPGEHQAVVLLQSHIFKCNFSSLKGLPQNLNKQTVFGFCYFQGEIDLGFQMG